MNRSPDGGGLGGALRAWGVCFVPLIVRRLPPEENGLDLVEDVTVGMQISGLQT